MRRPARKRVGQAFSLGEHQKVLEWAASGIPRWPSIELALNYPETPEMIGVVEHGQVGPTFLMWRTETDVVIEPLSGGTLLYGTLDDALAALTSWASSALQGHRRPLS